MQGEGSDRQRLEQPRQQFRARDQAGHEKVFVMRMRPVAENAEPIAPCFAIASATL